MKWLRRALVLWLLGFVCAIAVASARAPGRPSADNPLRTLQRTLGEAPLQGRVEQRLRAGSYTYLAVRTDAGALQWAAVLGAGPALGARASLRSLGHKRDFHSRRLARTFPDLMFAIVSRVD